jgi:hypothetical protein
MSWIDFFPGLAENGFSIKNKVFDEHCCSRVADDVNSEYERLVASGWRFCAGGRYTGHLNFHPGQYGQEMFAILKERGYIAAAEEFMGCPLNVSYIAGNINLGGSLAQEMHQDFTPPEEAFIFNIALVPTRSNNGATAIVPQSHGTRYTYRTLHFTGTSRSAQQIDGDPGDLLVRVGSLWHRGMPNRTPHHRPMLCICMVPADKPKPIDPADERIAFSANRFYGKHARMRELAEIYLAKAFHYYRIIKS